MRGKTATFKENFIKIWHNVIMGIISMISFAFLMNSNYSLMTRLGTTFFVSLVLIGAYAFFQSVLFSNQGFKSFRAARR